jgi:hypothetical protein
MYRAEVMALGKPVKAGARAAAVRAAARAVVVRAVVARAVAEQRAATPVLRRVMH